MKIINHCINKHGINKLIINRVILSSFTFFMFFSGSIGIQEIWATPPHLTKINNHTVLMVNDNPFIILSVEGPNAQGTQSGTLSDMDWAADNYCTVYKACVQWGFLEPTKDSYDWTFLDELINKARSKNIKLHLIFNGFNFCCRANYVPQYIKNDSIQYQRLIDSKGKEIPWTGSIQVCANDPEILDREKKMFNAFMTHLKNFDSQNQTVVMIQVENEPGIRDYANTIKRCYCSLCNNLKNSGNFSSDEEFYAWSIANHIEELAKSGRAIYDIPCDINAIITDEINNANAYMFRQIYLNTAAHIDIIAPDLYELNVSNFKNKLNLFQFGRNIIYVAETTSDRVKSAEYYIYHVLCEYGGLGLSPWSVNKCIPNSETLPSYNKGSEAGKELSRAYKALKDAMGPIAIYQKTDSMTWFVPDGASSFTKTVNGLTLNIKTLASQGKGIIIQHKKGVMDFTLIGNDYTVELPNLTREKGIKVEKGRWDGTNWIPDSTINSVVDNNKVTITMPGSCALRVFDPQVIQIKKTLMNKSFLNSDITVTISPTSEIYFSLSLNQQSNFSLNVSDVTGRQRWTHSQKNNKPGQMTILWANSTPGIYFVTLKETDRTLVKKFIVMQ